MVLRVTLVLAVVLAAGACKQSLFDSSGAPDGSGPVIPKDCPAPCLADAASDFDGTQTGVGMRWRYLDDMRARAWTEMTPTADGFVGANAMNTIGSCGGSSSGGCGSLPGALKVSSAGATSAADPAISYTAKDNQYLRISIAAAVPSGTAAQTIRLYRNSREDVLYTAVAQPGDTVGNVLNLDVLAGDRFYLAVAPDTFGANDVAVNFFVSDTGATFPQACKIASSFTLQNGNAIDNACDPSNKLTFIDDTTGPKVPVLAAGPFTDLGQAGVVKPDTHYAATAAVSKTGESTVQMWVKNAVPVDVNNIWLYSDLDVNAIGGLGIDLFNNGGHNIAITSITTANPQDIYVVASGPFPDDGTWHFVRAVQTGGKVKLCLDGGFLASFDAPADQINSSAPARIGNEGDPRASFLDGSVDDVRVIGQALPCE